MDLSLYPQGTTLDDSEGLVIGGCAVSDLAREYGTPLYLVDEGALRHHAQHYLAAFQSRHANSSVLFASKAFPSASVVKVVTEEGCGVDVASAGELGIALAAGADPARIVFHGNAKSDADIQAAIDAGVGYVVIDNLDDVRRVAKFATHPVPVLLRVSPSIAAATHDALATGLDSSKFGIPSFQIEETIARIREEPLLDLRGLHAHIGSQILDLDQFEAEVKALALLEHFPVYNFGGGLGVRYVHSDLAPTIEEYAERLVDAVHRYLGTEVQIMVEPGRSMVARNAVTVYEVVTVKRGARTHVAVNGGMSDNLEIALYGQPFEPCIVEKSGQEEIVDVVGQHCESGDFLVKDYPLPHPTVGDILAVPVTGAYCFTMRNNFNAALAMPVVFCRDGNSRVAVRRQTLDELLGREVLHSAPVTSGR
jgi:diaminopimelate decarboxylase